MRRRWKLGITKRRKDNTRRVRRTRSYNIIGLFSPKRSGSFDVANAHSTGNMFESPRRRAEPLNLDHSDFRQPTTSVMARMKEAFTKMSNRVKLSQTQKPMVIEHQTKAKRMGGRETETSIRYLQEVIRSGKKEVLSGAAGAVLDSIASTCNHKDLALQDAVVALLQYVDRFVVNESQCQLDSEEGKNLVMKLEQEIHQSQHRKQSPTISETTPAYIVSEPDSPYDGGMPEDDPGLEELMKTLTMRSVEIFRPQFPDIIDGDSDDDAAVTVNERKEERAEKHGQKTCEEEVEKLPDGTVVRKKNTRTVNVKTSSSSRTISTRGGNVPAVSRVFKDGSHKMNDDTEFETTDFFGSHPFPRMNRERPNLLNPEKMLSLGDGSEPGQSTKTKTVEATSEVLQSVAEKKQRNGRVLAENAAHQIDTTELNAKQIEKYKGQNLIAREGGGTYEESTITRNGLPGIEQTNDRPKKKHVVEYMQTFGTKKEVDEEEFLRGTTLASYVVLNDHLRHHEEQFRKKLTFEFSTSGISSSQTDFSNLAELLQSCSDMSNIRMPTKFQDQNEIHQQKSITFPKREAIKCAPFVLELLDVLEYLVLKAKDDASRPNEVRGGPADALIVYATQATGALLYQEAFLSTYRTFVSSHELLQKLIKRYMYMCLSNDMASQKSARLTFSVVVRVVDELCPFELTKDLVSTVTSFVYKLIRDGNFQLARLLRTRLMERIEANAAAKVAAQLPMEIKRKHDTIFDFRSAAVARQLTLLDQDLFQRIEPSEMLCWSQEQDEKKCPNLVTFTEQFNKMSYWVRTVVLTPHDHKEREKCLNKFIKIMKHLRRMGNLNAFLAILSALDSMPLRRLDWNSKAVEILKEHAVIIETAGSFKNYRAELANTAPPCIPYVGLVLQDLTFVHVGNINMLDPGSVGGRKNLLNFTKRWQQFAILDSIRKFKRWSYPITRDDRIVNMFSGFKSLTEEETWDLSESIKPPQRKNR